ncbi:MAG TPA: hypothetical protein VMF30_12305, partial [Pirellulales bacterium]|nr:hypothetical protein [Pirellulales bacterium]
MLALALWAVGGRGVFGQTGVARPARVSTQPASTAALTPAQQAFAVECETLRQGTILKLEESLRGLKSGQV